MGKCVDVANVPAPQRARRSAFLGNAINEAIGSRNFSLRLQPGPRSRSNRYRSELPLNHKLPLVVMLELTAQKYCKKIQVYCIEVKSKVKSPCSRHSNMGKMD